MQDKRPGRFRFANRWLWRDWRSGRLAILLAAIALCVTLGTGIPLFAERLSTAIAVESRAFLAADRVVSSSRPLLPDWQASAESAGLQTAATVEFSSMLGKGESLQLATVKAVSSTYPLRGEVRGLGPRGEERRAPAGGEIWLDERLEKLLAARLGDTIDIGYAQLRFSHRLVAEPDRGGGMFGWGSRAMMALEDVPATRVVQPGSRVQYRLLLAGDTDALETLLAAWRPQLQPGQRILGGADQQPRLAKSVDRAERYLLLAGSLTLMLGGLAASISARWYAREQRQGIALMRTLGASHGDIRTLVLWQLGGLLVAGTLMGWLAGAVLQEALWRLLPVDLPAVPSLHPTAFATGALTGLICLLAFAARPLWRLRSVPPGLVLRDLPESSRHHRWDFLLGAGGILLILLWYSRDPVIAFAMLAGTLLVALLIALLARVLFQLLEHGRRSGAWRLGLASLRRRRTEALIDAMAFSIGVLLLGVLLLTRTALLEDWRAQLPTGKPNHFLLNIAPQDAEPLQAFLHTHGLGDAGLFPMIAGRLESINGRSVRRDLNQDTGPRADRELSLTWAETLPEGNTLAAGRWWSPGSTPGISVEQEFATQLGIALGDTLCFRIGSESLCAPVLSLRTLRWESLTPNFYMLFHPNLLRNMPATWMTSLAVPQHKRDAMIELSRQFPTVSVIDVDAVLGQMEQILTRITHAIELVMWLVIVAAALVLLATLRAGMPLRWQETALLRALGASRRQVLRASLVEFGLLGAIAGLVGAAGAEAAIAALSYGLLDIPIRLHPLLWPLCTGFTALLVACLGVIATRPALRIPPLTLMRR